MTDWQAVRAQFPALRNWTFLNTATYGQLATRTSEAVMRHLARRDEFACSDFLSWFDDIDSIRGSIASLINSDPGDVAFFINANSALSLIMNAIEWRDGDRVLCFQNEFPNLLYWGEALASRGVVFDCVEAPVERIHPRTRLAMFSTINYCTGQRPNAALLTSLCRETGAISFVDGTQSLGALRFDSSVIRPDIFAVDGYKWLLCPNGAGFATISPQVRQWLPPAVIGWRSDRRWREVNALHQGAPEFVETAEKYEGGMVSFPSIYAMGASVEMMLEIGVDAIEARVLALAARVRDELRALGAKVLPYDDSPVIAARWPGIEPGELAARLREHRVLVAARQGQLRVSTHFYNDESDIARLVEVLKEVL